MEEKIEVRDGKVRPVRLFNADSQHLPDMNTDGVILGDKGAFLCVRACNIMEEN